MDLTITDPDTAVSLTTAGAAAAWGGTYAVSRWRRRRHLRAIRAANPPLSADEGDNPRWMTEFVDVYTMAHALNTDGRDVLDELFAAGYSRHHRRAMYRSLEVTEWAHRLAWTETYLDVLKSHCPAGELAAVAVLVRDLIPQEDFALLTQMWAGAGLGLPGGDVCSQYTVAVDHEVDGQWIELLEPEIVDTSTGESAEQIAHGVAEQLAAAQRADVGTWRVRVWARAITVKSDLRAFPADAECFSEMAR